MKLLTLLSIALVAGIGSSAFAADSGGKSKAKDGKGKEAKEAKPKETKSKGKLRHVVAFKFKESATKEDIAKVVDAFKALPAKIPQIAKFESGLNNSPEGHNKGCTHGWILSFNSDKDRDEYLVHPDHKEFGKLVGPLLADVFVIDFWTKE